MVDKDEIIDERYTEEGLPVLTRPAVDNLTCEMGEIVNPGSIYYKTFESGSQFRAAKPENLKLLLDRWQEEIFSENPTVSSMIQGLSSSYPVPFSIVSQYNLCYLYMALKSQASKNKAEDFNKMF